MISFLRVGQMPAAPNCDYMESGCCTFQVNVFVPLQAARRNYLKECRKCTLLRFSFSGLWDAMWENSLKMSRYVASPGEEKKKTQNVNDGKWFEWDLIRHGEEKERKKKKSDLVFLNSQNIFYMKPLSRGAVGKKKGRGERSGGTVKLRSFNSPDSEPLLFLWPW